MSSEILDFFINLVPSIAGIGTTIIIFYRNEQNLISFIIAILKVCVLMVSSIYLYYLLFIKKQEMRETSVKISLITSIFSLIFSIITVYVIYNQSITVQTRVTSNVKRIRDKIVGTVDSSQPTSSSNIKEREGGEEGKVIEKDE
jgi:ABC-type Fe3+-siderophore transport system permease subunit